MNPLELGRIDVHMPVPPGPWLELSNPTHAMDDPDPMEDNPMTDDELLELADLPLSPGEIDELARMLEDQADDPVTAPQLAAGRRADQILSAPDWSHVGRYRRPTTAAPAPRFPMMGFDPQTGEQNMLSDADRELRERAKTAREQQAQQERTELDRWRRLPTAERAAEIARRTGVGLPWAG